MNIDFRNLLHTYFYGNEKTGKIKVKNFNIRLALFKNIFILWFVTFPFEKANNQMNFKQGKIYPPAVCGIF